MSRALQPVIPPGLTREELERGDWKPAEYLGGEHPAPGGIDWRNRFPSDPAKREHTQDASLAACRSAQDFAGASDARWNIRFVQGLAAVGYKLSTTFDGVGITAPLPFEEGERYPYPSYIVPLRAA